MKAQIEALVNQQIEEAEYFFNLCDAEFWYEWGNEPGGHVSIGRYDKKDGYTSLGYALKSDVKKMKVPFHNPHS